MDNANPSMSRLGRREPTPMERGKVPSEEKMKSVVDDGAGGHMHEAAEKMHEAEPHAKHMLISHDGFAAKSHSIDEEGKHEEHDDEDDVSNHIKHFMGADEGEEDHDGGEEPEETDGNLY